MLNFRVSWRRGVGNALAVRSRSRHLLPTEAGGVFRRLDGSDYPPALPGEKLPVSGDEARHDRVAEYLGASGAELKTPSR